LQKYDFRPHGGHLVVMMVRFVAQGMGMYVAVRQMGHVGYEATVLYGHEPRRCPRQEVPVM
jgi:hypothetical protein